MGSFKPIFLNTKSSQPNWNWTMQPATDESNWKKGREWKNIFEILNFNHFYWKEFEAREPECLQTKNNNVKNFPIRIMMVAVVFLHASGIV